MTIPEMIVIVGAITQFLKTKGMRISGLMSVLLSAVISSAVVAYYYLKLSGAFPPAELFIEVFFGSNVGYQIIKSGIKK
jgi:hypothetical protein